MTTRKKKPARRNRKATKFTLVVEGQKMVVSYNAHWTADVGHFEFNSPHRPARRIPVSETGYFSHFAYKDGVKAARGPKAYSYRLVLDALAPRRALRPDERNQLSLFA